MLILSIYIYEAHISLFTERLDRGRVHPNSDVSDQPLGQIVLIHRNNRHNRVISTLDILRVHRVFSIRGPVNLRMRHIRLHTHNLLFKLLLKVQLASADGVTGNDGTVFANSPIGMHLGVDVDGTLDVEAYITYKLVHVPILAVKLTYLGI